MFPVCRERLLWAWPVHDEIREARIPIAPDYVSERLHRGEPTFTVAN
jgi:hypothetical protein